MALLSIELLAAAVRAVGLGVVLVCHLFRFGMVKSLCGERQKCELRMQKAKRGKSSYYLDPQGEFVYQDRGV